MTHVRKHTSSWVDDMEDLQDERPDLPELMEAHLSINSKSFCLQPFLALAELEAIAGDLAPILEQLEVEFVCLRGRNEVVECGWRPPRLAELDSEELFKLDAVL